MIIYKVTNTKNTKIYIGQTVGTLKSRKLVHFKRMLEGSETNFHRALRKYGKEVFIWETIHICNSKEELNKFEIFFIKKYNSYKDGYNMTLGGDGGMTYRKGDVLYERIKHKLGKWQNGNPGATPIAIKKRIESFKSVNWPSGESHQSYGKERKFLQGVPTHNAYPVIIDNIEYRTTGEAARILNLKDSEVVRCRCKSTSKKWKNYNYKN
jgi:group I intron endonuclease